MAPLHGVFVRKQHECLLWVFCPHLFGQSMRFTASHLHSTTSHLTSVHKKLSFDMNWATTIMTVCLHQRKIPPSMLVVEGTHATRPRQYLSCCPYKTSRTEFLVASVVGSFQLSTPMCTFFSPGGSTSCSLLPSSFGSSSIASLMMASAESISSSVMTSGGARRMMF